MSRLVAVTGASDPTTPGSEALDVAVEAVRRPAGFDETVEDRWILRVDAWGAGRPRSGARR